MLIYEVNATVNADAANTYAAWLGEHIHEMLEFDGFRSAALYDLDESAERGPGHRRRLTVHYHVESRAHLDAYFDQHAERMRQEGLDRFEGKFEADRRILEQRRVFSKAPEPEEDEEEGP